MRSGRNLHIDCALRRWYCSHNLFRNQAAGVRFKLSQTDFAQACSNGVESTGIERRTREDRQLAPGRVELCDRAEVYLAAVPREPAEVASRPPRVFAGVYRAEDR